MDNITLEYSWRLFISSLVTNIHVTFIHVFTKVFMQHAVHVFAYVRVYVFTVGG